MRPRVGIDAHHLSRLEGNRSYVLALLRALARAGASERFELHAFSLEPERDRALLGDDARAFAWGSLPRSALLRVGLGAALAQRRHGLDLWHSAWVTPSWLARARCVLAVHDALALVRPEVLPRAVARRLAVLLPRSIARAARVLVPTRAVADDLASCGLGAGKVVVAPIGVDDRVFAPPEEPRAVRDYVLAVGRPDPRKRLDLLVHAFARAPGASAARLVVAGPLGTEGERLVALARSQGVALELVESPDEAALAKLYRDARALAFPSIAEGLGLPVVEALACGTPVVATDLAAIREVAGDAALALVPADDRDALAAALGRALVLPPGERERLAGRGLLRARAFSLEAMARATEESYRFALGTLS